jgi:hypothetical protein
MKIILNNFKRSTTFQEALRGPQLSHCRLLEFVFDRLQRYLEALTSQKQRRARCGVRLMNKLVPLLAKMEQQDRNLILFLAGRVSQKRGGMKAGRKPASTSAT